jgi:hypothetical protein
MGALTSHNPMGLHGLLQGSLTLPYLTGAVRISQLHYKYVSRIGNVLKNDMTENTSPLNTLLHLLLKALNYS